MEKILLMVIAVELLAIWGTIYFQGVSVEESEKKRQEATAEFIDNVSMIGKTQFVESETIEDKYKKSDNIDEFLNQLK